MRRLREEIAGLWLTDPVRHHRPEPLDEVRATLALFDRDDLHDAAARLPRGRPRARPRGSGARRPRSRRSCAGAPGSAATATATRRSRPRPRRGGVGDRDRPRAARPRDRDPAHRPYALGERPRRAAVDGAAPGARARRSARFPARRASSRASCPTRPTAASSAWSPTGSPPRAPARRGAYDDPAAFVADLDVLQRSLDAGGAPSSRDGELQHLRWQAEAFGFHLAEMEVRQHAERARRRAAGTGAESRGQRARARPPGAGEGGHAARPDDGRDPRGARDVPGDQGHPGPARAGGMRPGHRELHAVGRRPGGGAGARPPRRRPPARPTCSRCPCSSRGTSSRTATAILDAWLALPGTKRLLRRHRPRAAGDGRLLRLREGSRRARREPRAVPGAARDGGVGARARRAAHDLPRARRRARTRRRPGQPGDPRAAAGLGRRTVQGHRAGRDGVRPLRRPGARPPPPRAAHERGRAGERHRRRARPRRPVRARDRS